MLYTLAKAKQHKNVRFITQTSLLVIIIIKWIALVLDHSVIIKKEFFSGGIACLHSHHVCNWNEHSCPIKSDICLGMDVKLWHWPVPVPFWEMKGADTWKTGYKWFWANTRWQTTKHFSNAQTLIWRTRSRIDCYAVRLTSCWLWQLDIEITVKSNDWTGDCRRH